MLTGGYIAAQATIYSESAPLLHPAQLNSSNIKVVFDDENPIVK